MFVEKRKSGKNIKYYLSHSYRDNDKVKKISRYLGQNLSAKDLEKNKSRAQQIILEQIEELKTEVFNFFLSSSQINQLNKYDSKLKIIHLQNSEFEKFKEDFVYNTNAIEGSSVLEDEVKDLLEEKTLPKTKDELETINVGLAVDFINTCKDDVSLDLILKLHEICFKGSKGFAGKLRDVEVVIKNNQGDIIHQGAPVSQLKEELDEFIHWYNENKNNFKPLILAALVHNQFEHIHPFQDGNGRVGRLLLNYILLKNNYPPINIFLEDRQEYYFSLREYSQNNNLKPTIQFLIKQYKKTLK
ncbi:MAG: Fic family protein [Candidatus Woesearchaeota archaeon]|jgi:Fic family protein|nr:Fic family protein [Candidatus Woesearchaeota archaeon]